MSTLERIESCVKAIRKKTDFVPDTALVLGSGLGALSDLMEKVCEISYGEIEGFPVSTVQGHSGKFVFGYVGKEPVVMMVGRVHFYEGYSMEEVVLPIRVMRLLGAKRLILTNAAGGIGPNMAAGDLMLITDHISTFVRSPLIGKNEEELGTRFPDMSSVYAPRLCDLARSAAKKTRTELKEGVYLQTTGPQYETPAEIRMFRAMGANAVGMSTACEAVAARHMGMEICGISCITNMAAGLGGAELNHEEVQETSDRSMAKFQKLLLKLLEMIA